MRPGLMQHPHSRARSERECRGSGDGFVVRERLAMIADRGQYAAPSVIDDEGPFATCTVVEVAARPEQSREFADLLDRK